MNTPVKLGFLGASRGMNFASKITKDYPYAQVTAICEAYAPLCEKAAQFFKEKGITVQCFTDFDKFLNESGIDAIIIANYANEHAPYAVRALEKGIHVYSEVMPVGTLAEAVELCEAVEKSGCVYAYGENYCFFNPSFNMRKVYESGIIGEAVCLEGTFINDCSFKWDLLTRGIRDHWRNFVPSTFYCSHSIGPMLYSTGRRAVRVNGFEIPRMNYMAEMGARSGSAAMEVLELDNGGIARSMNGNLRHPYEASYRLIGESGSIECNIKELKVIKHRSTYEYDTENINSMPPEFIFRPKSKHDFVSNSDCTAIGFFIGAILGDDECRKYSIDIYSALDMAVPGLLAHRSLINGGKPIEVPNFRDKKIRCQYINDNYSTDPKTPAEFLLPTSKSGTPEVSDSVYEAVAESFRNQNLKPGQN